MTILIWEPIKVALNYIFFLVHGHSDHAAEATDEILSASVGLFLLLVIECGAYYTIDVPGNKKGIPLPAVRMKSIGDTLSRVVGFAFIDVYADVQGDVVRMNGYVHFQETGIVGEYPIEKVALSFAASFLVLMGFLRLFRKAMLPCLHRLHPWPDQAPQPPRKERD